MMTNESLSKTCPPSGPCSPVRGSNQFESTREEQQRWRCTYQTRFSNRSMLINVLCITLSIFISSPCQAFTTFASLSIPSRSSNVQPYSFSPLSAAVIDNSPSSYEMSNFARRMKNLIKKDAKKTQPPSSKDIPDNLVRLTTLQEFKKVVGDEKEKLVVVRWYAPWCKVSYETLIVLLSMTWLLIEFIFVIGCWSGNLIVHCHEENSLFWLELNLEFCLFPLSWPCTGSYVTKIPYEKNL